MKSFRAYRIHEVDGLPVARLETLGIEDLTPGEVVIRTAYSGVNYKDALAYTGQGKILRRFPLVGGIDVAGTVVSSEDERFEEGDEVLVCGAELSEKYDGGYAEYARLRSEGIVRVPEGLPLRDAMAIGTAGFTAALGAGRMEDNGQAPGLGPVLVTGATGGVGSFAIDMLAGLGYEVVALTGKADQDEYLQDLGASQILRRGELELGARPLERTQWGGAVDSLGGEVLSWLTRTVVPFGSIASIGLAAGVKLETSVMPFILRGVCLLGVNSVLCSQADRERAWQRLASDLKPRHLDRIVTREIGLDELPAVFEGYLAAGVTGRTVVRIGD